MLTHTINQKHSSTKHSLDRGSETSAVRALLYTPILQPLPRSGKPIMSLHVSQPTSYLAELGIEPQALVCNCSELMPASRSIVN